MSDIKRVADAGRQLRALRRRFRGHLIRRMLNDPRRCKQLKAHADYSCDNERISESYDERIIVSNPEPYQGMPDRS